MFESLFSPISRQEKRGFLFGSIRKTINYGKALIYLGVGILILLSFIPRSFADQVTPSGRVISHLNVRQNPDVNSDVVGKLKPNETAELLESVPYWYKIRLNNGTQGFVSKAWAVKVADAEETGQVIRVGSWNIKKLGHGSSKDYDRVATIINSNFDLIAVVEVMQKQNGHPGYDSLMAKLGSEWNGLITNSPRPNTTAGHAEFYAILYRVSIIRPCAGWTRLVYHVDNDGGPNGTGNDIFSREPAYACFEAPLNDSSIGFDFLIAAYHAR